MNLPDFLTYGFMQRAYMAGLLSAATLSVVGIFIVLKRLSNIGEGLANIAFAGIALGLLFGAAPLPLALIASVIGVFLINYLKGRAGVYGEAAVQILCSGGLALGVVAASASAGFNVNLLSYLFGSLLSVTTTDILFVAALAVIVFTAVALTGRQLAYATFDEDSARASGLQVDRLNLMLMLITAVSVVAGMRIVGILLVSSFLVVPAAAAILLARNFRQAIAFSLAYGVTSAAAGITLAYYLNVATGGAVVLTSVLMFFATAAFARFR
ncbi:ABC 3 transport family protein [uncultured archaeon]|nr:ABC 3 transport family protein [uncultured archaeon]